MKAKASDTDRFLIQISNDEGNMTVEITGTTFNKVLNAKNHQERIDTIIDECLVPKTWGYPDLEIENSCFCDDLEKEWEEVHKPEWIGFVE